MPPVAVFLHVGGKTGFPARLRLPASILAGIVRESKYSRLFLVGK
jgi:hypothetical protein